MSVVQFDSSLGVTIGDTSQILKDRDRGVCGGKFWKAGVVEFGCPRGMGGKGLKEPLGLS